MEVIELSGYMASEKQEIAREYVSRRSFLVFSHLGQL
jgi:ATP-dependent Lon protease